jgi:putative restriction endonuclease
MPRILWTREEHLLVFQLYCQIPFGSIHIRNPKVIALAKLLGRKVGAVSLKLANFARLDPNIIKTGRRGMSHGAKGEEEVWREFADHPEELVFESTRLLAKRQGKTIEAVAKIQEIELPPEGLERERLVRVRVNQQFFRSAILAAYDNRCCVTGLSVQELLVASHIIPWAHDAKLRMNPCNGLCLNALHDRAFDRGLMVISDTGTVKLRKDLRETCPEDEPAVRWLCQFDGQPLRVPRKFPPDPVFLAEHRKRWG